MGVPKIAVDVTLHGFPGLEGDHPMVSVEMDAAKLTAREVCKALLQHFGPAIGPALGPATTPGGTSRGLYMFVNDQPVTNFDEMLQPHVLPEGRVSLELIRVKAIAGG